MTDDDLVDLERRRAEAFDRLVLLNEAPLPTDLAGAVEQRDALAAALADAGDLSTTISTIWRVVDVEPRRRRRAIAKLVTGYLDD